MEKEDNQSAAEYLLKPLQIGSRTIDSEQATNDLFVRPIETMRKIKEKSGIVRAIQKDKDLPTFVRTQQNISLI